MVFFCLLAARTEPPGIRRIIHNVIGVAFTAVIPVAMLFGLFDLEAVFFYPWGALFRDLGFYGFVAMTIFTVPLVIGLLYEWRKGALEW